MLAKANREFAARRPGISDRRQPVHTVYGGAHLFKADTPVKIGQVALNHVQAYASDFIEFAQIFQLPGYTKLPTQPEVKRALMTAISRNPDSLDNLRETHRSAWLAARVYERVLGKLRKEPVEDFRIDFEDGFGVRDDQEEDAEARRTAEEVAAAMAEGVLPPFIGIRIKPLNDENVSRSLRTLDIFLNTLFQMSGSQLPDNFVVTLPKATIPEQVKTLVAAFEAIEEHASLAPGSLKMELMVETPTSVIAEDGTAALPKLVEAAEGRCTAVHFGVYDYTASLDITAAHQRMRHPSCDFARHVMQVSMAGSGVFLSDGATNIMPVGPHRSPKGGPPLTSEQSRENAEVVHRAWRYAYADTMNSLQQGIYQGWDLHPAQLTARYAAVYTFFLEGLDAASERLSAFVEKAARATLVGDVFDDAATGQGLLNYFLSALNCGAISPEEALRSGLTQDELRSRSFTKIIQDRAGVPEE